MADKPPRDIHDTFHVQWLNNAEHLFACAQLVQDKHLERMQAFRDEHAASGQILYIKPITKDRFLYGFGQYLLIGLALETMFKAIWMRKKSGIVQQVPGFWGGVTGHNLVKLAQSVSFDLDDEEKKYLDELTEVVIWMGKYPVDFKRASAPVKTSWALSFGNYAELFERLRETSKKSAPDPSPTSQQQPPTGTAPAAP